MGGGGGGGGFILQYMIALKSVLNNIKNVQDARRVEFTIIKDSYRHWGLKPGLYIQWIA